MTSLLLLFVIEAVHKWEHMFQQVQLICVCLAWSPRKMQYKNHLHVVPTAKPVFEMSQWTLREISQRPGGVCATQQGSGATMSGRATPQRRT